MSDCFVCKTKMGNGGVAQEVTHANNRPVLLCAACDSVFNGPDMAARRPLLEWTRQTYDRRLADDVALFYLGQMQWAAYLWRMAHPAARQRLTSTDVGTLTVAIRAALSAPPIREDMPPTPFAPGIADMAAFDGQIAALPPPLRSRLQADFLAAKAQNLPPPGLPPA
jgi:hypothetical protein